MSNRTGRVEEDLPRHSLAWMDAIGRRDAETLDRIVAEEFTFTSERGRWGKAIWMRNILDRWSGFAARYSDVQVHDYGDVAVMHSRFDIQAVLDGTDMGGAYLASDVWVRRDGRWQVVSRHLNAVPDAPATSDSDR